MDDFIYVLVASLVILAGLVAFSSLGPIVPSTGPQPMYTSIESFFLGDVGFTTTMPVRTLSFGAFTVGQTQSESLKSIPETRIASSWFGTEQESLTIEVPSYYLDTLRDIKIDFNVYDTNQYGRLVIEWNGREVFREFADRGAYSVGIDPNFVRESNTLKIMAEGPGLIFWASSTYILQNLDIEVEYGPEKVLPFQIMSGELQSFDKGEISFYSEEDQNLTVKVNNIEIYSDSEFGSVTMDFDFFRVPLQTGNNILSFSSPSSLRLRNVELKIFLLSNEITRTRFFNITGEHLNLLNQGVVTGKIEVIVDTITRPGALTVKLNGHSLSVPTIQEGSNTITFYSGDVMEGENELRFSGTGSFYISEANVGLQG